jgi:hypothetical protein
MAAGGFAVAPSRRGQKTAPPKARLTVFLITPRPAPKRPLAHAEQLHRLRLIELGASQRLRRFKNTVMRAPGRASVQRIQTLPKGAGLTGQTVRYLNRTYRVLATKDAHLSWQKQKSMLYTDDAPVIGERDYLLVYVI